jgi:phosphinothricin acetyltransferase
MDVVIRAAGIEDAGAMLAIYAPYVIDTAISFEVEPPSLEDFRGRVARGTVSYPWYVAERAADRAVVGYAYAGEFRARAAYRFTAETTVYVARGAHRSGIGRALMQTLLPELSRRGFHRVIAGVTLPNAASVGLHESLGFRPVGVFEEVGFKFGAWHAVGFWQLPA